MECFENGIFEKDFLKFMNDRISPLVFVEDPQQHLLPVL